MFYCDMFIKKVLVKCFFLEFWFVCGRCSVKELMDLKIEIFEFIKNSKFNFLKLYVRDDIICFVYRVIFVGWDVDV